ncbi:hypothetical protein FRC11_014621 [Ceratobasidium sp. 423]|nr:hypothetical protein FRC11_014621 [Ceratobasidium sp. 423]
MSRPSNQLESTSPGRKPEHQSHLPLLQLSAYTPHHPHRILPEAPSVTRSSIKPIKQSEKPVAGRPFQGPPRIQNSHLPSQTIWENAKFSPIKPARVSNLHTPLAYSTSGKPQSVRFNVSEDYIAPGQYSPHTPKYSIPIASAAIDSILRELVDSVNNFKCPSELDFSANIGSPLVLANVEKNKPFFNQLRKLDQLRIYLGKISTQGDVQLDAKHKAARVAIRRALQRMREYQLKLYQNFIEQVLDNLLVALHECVKKFEYPSELDFPKNTENHLLLLYTEKNKSFIHQYHSLDQFQDRLNEISTPGNKQLGQKYRDAAAIIKEYRRRLKKHQLELHKKFNLTVLKDPPIASGSTSHMRRL